jgi:translin
LDLASLTELCRSRLEKTSAAREQALAAGRRSIRASANAIRAVHRGDLDRAHALMDESRAAIDAGTDAVRAEHPDVYHAGFLQDAEKEYAEARLTEALIAGAELPGPDELGVELAPYLNGMAETIGEGRRAVLDLLRRGEIGRAEALMGTMDDLHELLATMDFPDAMTRNLRRSTDAARAIIERTRGDLTMTAAQRSVQDALERHARELHPGSGSR